MHFIQKNTTILLAATWIMVQAFLLYSTDINSSGEAYKYIGQAYHLIHDHHVDEARYVFYFIPIALLAVAQYVHLQFIFYIGIQLLLNIISAVAFYRIADFLFKNKIASFISTFIFITFIPYESWNIFLYTDSVFYSFSLLFLYTCIVLDDAKKSTHFFRVALLIVLVFTRPLGILYIPALFAFYFSRSKINSRVKIFCALFVAVLVLFAINYLYQQGGGDMNILFPQVQGYVICFQYSSISPNAAGIMVSDNPVKDLIVYIIQNPLRFLQLAGLRFLSFFNLCRPYYSFTHNIYLAINMLALYFPAIISLLRFSLFRSKSIKHLILVLFVLFIAGVMLQCDDFNSRFIMPLFPPIILFAMNFYSKNGWNKNILQPNA